MDTMKTKTFRGFLIYQVQGTNEFISLTENPSTHQVVSALKNAGFIKKGARYSSYRGGESKIGTDTDYMIELEYRRNGSWVRAYCLFPVAE